MRSVICRLVFSIAILQPSAQASAPDSPTYVAAVVEYSPDTGSPGDSVADIVSKNVAQYVPLIRRAAEQEVDIIVFPECGLVTYGSSTKFATPLPHPDDRVNPCTDTSSNVAEAIRTLSCAARNHSIYVVVNLPEVHPCPDATNCSSSSVVYYNSNVVFDRNGTVVARYRKFNLFGEVWFNITSEAELSVFDTDFGVTFGIFTCFDIIFEKPAVSLAKVLGVRDVVFPTAWYSELPFLTAVQAQASWSYGLDVNFLGAGYSLPGEGSAGSGIYAGKEGPLVTTMPGVPTTQLLVAKVLKKTPRNTTPVLENVWNAGDSIEATPSPNIFSDVHRDNSGIWMMRDYLEPYETLLLTETEFFSTHTLCHNELCCDFEVAMHTDNQGQNSLGKSYIYRLAVFDGIRSYTFKTGGVQVCAVMFCTNNSLSSCGYEMETDEQERFAAVFDYIHISGNFRLNNSLQLPNTLLEDYKVLSADAFEFTREEIPGESEVKVNMRTKKQNLNLLTFAIFGRDFSKDGGPVSQPSVDDANHATVAHLLSPIATLLCMNSYFYVKFLV